MATRSAGRKGKAMLKSLKHGVKKWLRTRDYFLVWVFPEDLTGFDLEDDLRRVIRNDAPVIIDVGANEGQTIAMMQRTFKNPRILAFEPSPRTFPTLKQQNFGPAVTLFHMALGSYTGSLLFHEYERSDLSSALEIAHVPGSPFDKIRELASVEVSVTTLDELAATQKITTIDLLKIDTQGFDLEVLKGADKSLSAGVVNHVLVELNFSCLYKDQASARDIHSFLEERGFALVNYYEQHHFGCALAWCTALFRQQRGKS